MLLTRRALVLAKVESTYNTEETLDAAVDAILAEEPDYQVDPTVLERKFATADLSPKAHVIGRKLAKVRFTTELRGNNLQDSGSLSDAPVIGRLFQACGYAATAVAAPEALPIVAHGTHTNVVDWAVDDTGLTNTEAITYTLTVTTAGASGAAKITITSDTSGEAEAEAIVTTAVAFGSTGVVGTKGLELTPTFTGNLALGQAWSITILPTGIKYTPVSTGQKSLTMKVFYDGVMHKLTGVMGTFSITAEAGQYAKVSWDFTGQFYATTDAPFPNATFETALPPMVELAKLRIDAFSAVVAAYNYEQANTISPRPDVNSSDGYNGVRITGRNPTGGIDPEAELVATQDFWGKMSSAKTMPFQMRIGSTAGNTVWIYHPACQYSGLTYRDRDGVRTYDAGLGMKRYTGDDETLIFLG